MQPLAWDELQDFQAVARSGSIARAAEALNVNSTTVGRRLKRLQQRLGQTLFEQTRAGQVLTDHGLQLLKHVELMQRAADRIAESTRRDRGLSGVLRVSVSEGFGTWFIADHLHGFVEQHPALLVELVASSGILNPSRREADVAIMLGRPQRGPVVSSKLIDYTLHLYAAPAYLDRYGIPGRPTDLAVGHHLAGYVPDLLYAPELDYLNEVSPDLPAHVRSSSIIAQYRLIASGLAIGVLPRFIGSADPTLVNVLPDVTISRAFWIVTHRDTRQLERVRAFRAWLLQLVAAHRGSFVALD